MVAAVSVSSEPNWIVVEDPKGEYWEGSLLSLPVSRQLKARGAAVLPIDPNLMKRSGVGGFMKRAWGAGYPLDYQRHAMCCPLTIYATVRHAKLHWVARLVPGDRIAKLVAEGKPFEGSLQLTADSSQMGTHHAGMQQHQPPVASRDLGKLDELGGWLVGGESVVRLAMDGHHGFGLYGSMPGVRVAWLAATITCET